VVCNILGDGTKLVLAPAPGRLAISTDSGLTWTRSTLDRYWEGPALSPDGTKLAVSDGATMYTSSDLTATWDNSWTIPGGSMTGGNYVAAAPSLDGTKLVMAQGGGYTYTSTDSGANWTQRGAAAQWISVASSADGTKLVAAVGGSPTYTGNIYTSNDSGVTWTSRATQQNWASVASSSDGSRLIAAAAGGYLYTSSDSGVTWKQRSTQQTWSSVASSADGGMLFATGGGGLYLSSGPVP
jgi:hypothetical protein